MKARFGESPYNLKTFPQVEGQGIRSRWKIGPREMRLKVKTLHAILCLLSTLVHLNCDSSRAPDIMQPASEVPFTDLQVGQEWRYAKWEKPYFGNRTFTGDTVSITIIAKEGETVTFYERTVNDGPISPTDTATFRFQIAHSLLRQVGTNRSRVFGFIAGHDSVLSLTDIDSNHVAIDLDTSLFFIREQTGKNRFVGHADSVRLLSGIYANVIVYYNEIPTYVDGFGYLAILSLKKGMVATVYFGGFSPIEQYGYQLIRP